MSKTLIYSCIFFNENYINLIDLLLKSYKLFGNPSDDIDYLIICNPQFKEKIQKIFYNLNINGKIWCIDLKTKFEAGYSRLKIFDYPDINLYEKILYLDADILITNSINNILDFQLENKLYTLQEGNTNHPFWGSQFFDKNPNCTAFTSGILLFNNNIIIKDLFSQILLHIHDHINSMIPIPECLDQPFIIYHAVKSNLYDNQKLITIVINNPTNFNNETICHFPGGPGHIESKMIKMSRFMNNMISRNAKNKKKTKRGGKRKKKGAPVGSYSMAAAKEYPGDKNMMFKLNKKTNTESGTVLFDQIYKWENSSIIFLENGKMKAFGEGKYDFIINI